MKNLKLAVMAGILASCVGSSVYADTFQVNGDVNAINTLLFTASNLSFATPLSAAAHSLAIMEIDNNDSDGFIISVSSEKGGSLVKHNGTDYVTTANAGEQVGYTVTFAPVSGTLGATEPGTFQTAFTPGTTATNFSFSSPTRSTVDKKYSVTLTVADTSHLLESQTWVGTYRDTLTITHSNI